jgi:hypothetical protein
MPQSLQKLLIYIGLALFLIFMGYHLMSLQPVQEAPVAEDGSSQMVGEDIISLVDRLKMISIDKSIFSSAIFSSLIDYNVNLYPESQGRPNPFAPLGNDNGTINQTILSGTR